MSSESATAQIPPGIYRISVAAAHDVESEGASATIGQYLTDEEPYVTVLPPSTHLHLKQLWRVSHGEHGSTVIGRPSNKWPSPYLSYAGNHQKPKEGDRIKVHVSDFPLNVWDLKPVHGIGHRFRILAEKSDLNIQIGPERIFPPFLILSKRELVWEFQSVKHDVE